MEHGNFDGAEVPGHRNYTEHTNFIPSANLFNPKVTRHAGKFYPLSNIELLIGLIPAVFNYSNGKHSNTLIATDREKCIRPVDDSSIDRPNLTQRLLNGYLIATIDAVTKGNDVVPFRRGYARSSMRSRKPDSPVLPCTMKIYTRGTRPAGDGDKSSVVRRSRRNAWEMKLPSGNRKTFNPDRKSVV